MITTKELAALAGVSQSTVSRSLHDSPRISKETRAKVRALAIENGYALRQKDHKTKVLPGKGGIAILLSAEKLSAPLDLYLEYLLAEIIVHVEKQGYYSVVLRDGAGEAALLSVESVLEAGSIKGVIVINNNFSAELEQALKRHHIPHIYAQYFSRPMKKNLNIIDVDHHAGGLIATEHLLCLGHRQIGTLTANGSDFEERTAGYRAALGGYGLACRPEWIIKSGITYAGAYKAMQDNWPRLSTCTAFFAQTDIVGIGVVNFLEDNGYDVPGRYSVIGFDGIPEGHYCRPGLSTVIQPIHEIAELSLCRLAQMIEQKDTRAVHLFVQPRLHLRGSTAAVPDAE